MAGSYITEKAIRRGVEVMTRADRERTPEQHEKYVRYLIEAIREHLVQRHLYDAVVRELQQERGLDAP